MQDCADNCKLFKEKKENRSEPPPELKGSEDRKEGKYTKLSVRHATVPLACSAY